MGDRRRAFCRVCKRHRNEVGELSWTGLCPEHSEERRRANFDAMQTMSGPYARHWRARMAASVGAVLLDDAQAKP